MKNGVDPAVSMPGPPGWNDTQNDTPGGVFVVCMARLRAGTHLGVRSSLPRGGGGQSIDFPGVFCREATVLDGQTMVFCWF